MISPVEAACGPDCAAFVARWQVWWRNNRRAPLAMLDCQRPYMPAVGCKTRNMVRKADSLYLDAPFAYNDRLAEIDAVNASKAFRQGRPMEGWYTRPAEPTTPARLCAVHRDTWYGASERLTGRLAAYARVARVSDRLAILVSFLAHGQAPAAANGLLAYLAGELDVRWLNYLHMTCATPSLEAFKRHAGFQEVDCA